MTLAKERGIETADPDEFNIEIGMGVTAQYNGKDIFVGKEDFMRSEGIPIDAGIEQMVKEQTHQGRTVVLVADGKCPAGLIAIADEIRPQTHQAIAS
jgi:cation transport ATPase